MKNLKDKQREFLNETVEYFNSNNRGIKNGLCSYQSCAIGRHIKDKKLCKKLDGLDSSVSNNNVFELLPFELQSLTKNFLVHIQSLHDSSDKWDESGLSRSGKLILKDIKERFGL